MKDNMDTTAGNIEVIYNGEETSLYEYLGKPAGSELGRAVYTEASKRKVKVTSHEVSNPKYTGRILKYPKSFLDSYFNKNNNGL